MIKNYVEKNGFNVEQKLLKETGWTFQPSETIEIFKYIEKIGTPLKDLNLKIYRGILTGFNEAFIIDEKTKNELIKKDPKSAEVIKPLIRGRDIKEFGMKWRNEYIIFTRRGIDIDKYPAIKEHLSKFRKQLEPKPENWDDDKNGEWEGRKPGQYKWYEIQDTVDFYQEFEKPKIIYPEIGYRTFVYDINNFYTNNKCFILATSKKYLTLFFSSNLLHGYFTTYGATLGKKGYEYRKIFMERLPIVLPENETSFTILTDYLLFLSQLIIEGKNGELERMKFYYQEIANFLIYELYFSEKFNTNLSSKLDEKLKSIEYEKWCKLHFKSKLSEEEREKKENLEKENLNLKIIKEVYDMLRNDREILKDIETIKCDEWVRIIEKM